MTPKQKVLQVYPEAYAQACAGYQWVIYASRAMTLGDNTLCSHKETEAKAWVAAANLLTPKRPERDQKTKAMFAPHEKLKIEDPIKKKRVAEIASQIVSSRAFKNEFDITDPAALKKEVMRASKLALEAYNAAEEFICG